MAEDKKKTPSPGGHEAHKGEASKEKGKTGNLQHANGVLLSTGGGTPIGPGEKWTDEHRVLQPRDPATGTFTYNSEAKWGLKYKQRNKANTVPPSARELVLAAGIDPKDGMIHKGDVIVWNGKTQIALQDMKVEELYDYFKKYDENTGEYYVGKAQKESQSPSDNKKLSSNFVTKQGRHSKAENEGLAKGDNPFRVVGHYDMDKLSNKTAEAIAKKVEETAKGFTPSGWSVEDAVISSDKYDANQHWNETHPVNPKKPKNPNVPNPTGPGKGPDNPPNPPKDDDGPKPPKPPKGGGGDSAKPKRMSSSGGLVKDGKIVDKSKIDYSNPVHKKYFDDVAADMKRNPKKYHMTPEMANAMNGAIVANGAKKGLFDKMNMKWEE